MWCDITSSGHHRLAAGKRPDGLLVTADIYFSGPVRRRTIFIENVAKLYLPNAPPNAGPGGKMWACGTDAVNETQTQELCRWGKWDPGTECSLLAQKVRCRLENKLQVQTGKCALYRSDATLAVQTWVQEAACRSREQQATRHRLKRHNAGSQAWPWAHKARYRLENASQRELKRKLCQD